MAKELLNIEIYRRQAELCAALAHPVRMMIIDLLSESEATATDLQNILNLPKSNLSQHLTVLKRAGLLKIRNEGLYQHMSLAMPQIKKACALVRDMLSAQMTKEGALAKELKG